MSLRTSLALVFCVAHLIEGELVRWNHRGRDLSCEGDTLVLPAELYGGSRGALSLPQTLPVAVVLPETGHLLPTHTLLGEDCGREEATYHTVRARWNSANSWRAESWNLATPHRDRVPCESDVAVLTDGAYLVDMPDRTQRVAAITIGGEPSSVEELRADGRFLPNSRGDIGLIEMARGCSSVSGCVCQKEASMSCEDVVCQPAECGAPLRPDGHCCDLCGEELSFSPTERFHMGRFRELIANAVQSEGGRGAEWWAGVSPGGTVHAVVTTERHGVLAAVKKAVTASGWTRGEVYARGAGGGRGEGLWMFWWCLLAVLASAAVVYLLYYPPANWDSFHLGEWNARRERSDSVVWLTRGSRANPLYDSRRETLSVVSAEDDEYN